LLYENAIYKIQKNGDHQSDGRHSINAFLD